MKQYEDDLYESWIETVSATLPSLLKKTVLTKPPPPQVIGVSTHSMGSRPTSRIDYSFMLPPGKQ